MRTTGDSSAIRGRLAIVGSGWRAECFLRVVAALGDEFEVTGVVSPREASRDTASRRWGIPAFSALRSAVETDRPDFVVVAVPWEHSPAVIGEAVALGVPVLGETPPALDLASLVDLWNEVGASGLVQIAEQYPRYPGHAARAELLRRGMLGTIGNAQVSSTHGYHAVALLRAILGVGFREVSVTAFEAHAPLANPLIRDGWTDSMSEESARNTTAFLDFGSGRTALYDFTDNQWHNELRTNRILIRGSLGEVVGDHVVHLVDPRTIVESDLARRQLGTDMNFEGFDLDHISFEGSVLYRNQWSGARLADDELAIADLLAAMSAWVRGEGPEPYPLAEASQDHAIALAIEESARSGKAVHVQRQPWAG